MTAFVYRFYDAEGQLVYVGRTLNISQRLAAHQSYPPLFDDVDTIKLTRYATAEEAVAAEREAIATEHPTRNVKLVTPETRDRNERVRSQLAADARAARLARLLR